MRKLAFLATIVGLFNGAEAQTDTMAKGVPLSGITASSNNSNSWYDRISLRGYTQVRYNRLLETNPNLKCEQCDKSIGEGGGFFIRRIRLIFYGQIHKNVYFYIQPDFASASGSSEHYAQIRDAYFDVGFDPKNEFRLRIGQSKVPFGFENMQSSQNRLSLDRNDALNSALKNERDLGVFFYWAPAKKREMFKMLVKDGLKGSGDYGVFAFGAYNGQTANSPEKNNSPHIVSRISVPVQIGSQIIEPGIQAYSGKYVLTSYSSKVKRLESLEYTDERVAGSFVLYPKPFGIQAEYNVGRGPEFNKATDSIELRNLKGGYCTFSYFIQRKKSIIIPFARGTVYEGGKKHETDARSYSVKELDLGVEWQPARQFELVVMYVFSERRFEDFAKQDNFQKGRMLRIQAQINI